MRNDKKLMEARAGGFNSKLITAGDRTGASGVDGVRCSSPPLTCNGGRVLSPAGPCAAPTPPPPPCLLPSTSTTTSAASFWQLPPFYELEVDGLGLGFRV